MGSRLDPGAVIPMHAPASRYTRSPKARKAHLNPPMHDEMAESGRLAGPFVTNGLTTETIAASATSLPYGRRIFAGRGRPR